VLLAWIIHEPLCNEADAAGARRIKTPVLGLLVFLRKPVLLGIVQARRDVLLLTGRRKAAL
jgi:hypothetical protein